MPGCRLARFFVNRIIDQRLFDGLQHVGIRIHPGVLIRRRRGFHVDGGLINTGLRVGIGSATTGEAEYGFFVALILDLFKEEVFSAGYGGVWLP